MRLYALLLRLYPASFRVAYEREMRGIHRARRRDVAGILPVIGFWIALAEETMFNAAAAHWDILRQDLRLAARSLRRAPGFALTAILVIALGIGANTAVFSVADFVLVRPLPYAHPDRLLTLAEAPREGGTNQVSPALYRAWSTSNRSFASMGAYYDIGVNLVGGGEPEHLKQTNVSASLLPTLGVPPLRGRLFDAAAAGDADAGAVILSYALWQSRFGGDEHILGTRLLVDGLPRVVIGVMPATFHFPSPDVALWARIGADAESDEDLTNTYWNVLARLRPAVSVEQARAEMDALARRLVEEHPKELDGIGVATVPLRDAISSQSRLLLLVLCAAAACVLLITCVNLANLLLARALVRRREFLVRAALGAERERLVRQSVTESLVLALLGGVAGVGVAMIALPLLTQLVPATLPLSETPTVDGRMIFFAGVLATLTGLAFGAFPAWRLATATDLSGLREGARTGGGRHERARSILVIAEVMTSVVLLISAGLLLRALVRVQDTDPGFRADHVLALRTELPTPAYQDVAKRAAFYEDVLRDVRAMPGVRSAGYISGLPMASMGAVWPVVPDGQGEIGPHAPTAISRYVTSGFFATLGIPLQRGRDVSDADRGDQPWVAVVSESFVRRFWPNEDPIGKRIFLLNAKRTIVGVVGDVRVRGLEQSSEPQVYLSYRQVEDDASSFFFPRELVVRSSVPPSSLAPAVREVVHRADPQQPVSRIRPMTEIVSDATAARSIQVRVLGAFALVAYLLAAIGIHGLLAFSVSSRRREIGVRMALGAQRSEIVRLITRKIVLLALAGVLPGIVIAFAAGRAMRSLLAGITPNDGITFGAAVALCILMTLLGCLVPTLRAVRVQPAEALRSEA
jgi:putative ABC transport system permease protein